MNGLGLLLGVEAADDVWALIMASGVAPVANRVLYGNGTTIAQSAGLTFDGTAFAVASGTITTSQPAVSATQTWNAGGVTFTAAKVNVTDTASATASLLLDLQVAASSKFSVSKAGNALVAGTLGVTGATTLAGVTASSVTDSGLTSGRVTFASTAGLLADSANLTWNGSTLAVTGAGTFSTTLGVTGLATLTGGLTSPAAIVSTLATGTAPFTIASTTVVGNLNVSQLLGSTWAAPGSIGSGTPAAGAFTTLSATGAVSLTTASSGLTISKTTGTTLVVSSTDPASATFAGGITTAAQTALCGAAGSGACVSAGGTTPAAISATTEYGFFVDFRSNSAATANTRGMFLRGGTAAAAYTTAVCASLVIGNSVAGAGSTITAGYGIQISQQNSATNNYGIVHSTAPSAGNFFIYDDIGYASKVSGVWTHTDATDAAAVGTASVVLAGGIGVAKAAFIGGLLNVAGAATLQSTLSVASTLTLTGSLQATGSGSTFTNAAAECIVNIGNSTGGWPSLRMLAGSTHPGWLISAQNNVSECFEITPSTANGGTTFSTPVFLAFSTGSIVIGPRAALATNATDGFLYMPTCAGTPTGVPTAVTGKVAHVYDTTNNKLYCYNGAWKATAALT